MNTICFGRHRAIAVQSDGTVIEWNINTGVTLCKFTDVVSVACGIYHAVALKADGTVVAWGWGDKNYNVPENLTGVISISCGFYHTVALKADGTVVAWGSNFHDECNVPEGLSNVIKIYHVNAYTVVAVLSNGQIVSWGNQNLHIPPNLVLRTDDNFILY